MVVDSLEIKRMYKKMIGFTLVSKAPKGSEGFTLVELLIAISIIVMLVALTLITFSDLQKNSRDSKRKSDLKVIQSALETYRADQHFFPSSWDLTSATPPALDNFTGHPTVTPTPILKTYLKKVPVDPAAGSTYCYQALYPGCINSTSETSCNQYELFATMENSDNAVSSLFKAKDALAVGTTTVTSITPSSAVSTAGVEYSLTARFANTLGNTNISNAYIYITMDGLLSSTEPYFYAYYANQPTNKLYIWDKTAGNWYATSYTPTVVGTPPTLQNFTFSPANTNTGGTSGNNLVINWKIKPASGAVGRIYTVKLRATDNGGSNTGWVNVGTWQVDSSVVGLTNPNLISIVGSAQSEAATYTNSSGYTNINNAFILISDDGDFPSTGNDAAWGYYDRVSNKLYLRNLANNAWTGGYAPGSNNTITVGNWSLNTLGTNITGSSGNNLVVNWQITPNSGAENKTYKVYLKDQYNGGGDSGQVFSGYWIVNPTAIDTATPFPSRSPTPTATANICDDPNKYNCGGSTDCRYNYKVRSP